MSRSQKRAGKGWDMETLQLSQTQNPVCLVCLSFVCLFLPITKLPPTNDFKGRGSFGLMFRGFQLIEQERHGRAKQPTSQPQETDGSHEKELGQEEPPKNLPW